MEKKIKYIFNKFNKDYLIIFLISLIICIPMLSGRLDVYADDGIQHIARAFGTFENIKAGVKSKVIFSFANGYGYSWDLFYGPLTTCGIIFGKILSGSWIIGYKLFCFISLLLSGIYMYKFMYKFSENKNTALLSGALYMLFPYHLTDLYIRNALGEFVSFVFIPLVFLGLYNLFNNKDKNYYLTFGAAGLILTHNLSSLIVAIFSVFYILMNIKEFKDRYVIKSLLLNVVFILLITSFFWMPLIETKLNSDYMVYEKDFMSDIEMIENQTLKIRKLFATPTEERVVFELGPHMIIMLVFVAMTLKNLKENKKEYIFFLVSGIICLWMTTKYFPWRILPDKLYIIQFPWRMLGIASFFLCIIASMNMESVIKKYKRIDTMIIISISLIYMLSLSSYIPFLENKITDIEKWKLGEMSGKEYEVVAGTAKAEYLPKNAYDNRFYIATREDLIYTLNGKAIIENVKKENGYLEAKVTIVEENTVFELPFIYYPGYEIRLDGIIVKDTFETENGFLGIKLDKDKTVKLEAKYVGTTIVNISNFIAIVSFITLIYIIWKKDRVKKEI